METPTNNHRVIISLFTAVIVFAWIGGEYLTYCGTSIIAQNYTFNNTINNEKFIKSQYYSPLCWYHNLAAIFAFYELITSILYTLIFSYYKALRKSNEDKLNYARLIGTLCIFISFFQIFMIVYIACEYNGFTSSLPLTVLDIIATVYALWDTSIAPFCT